MPVRRMLPFIFINIIVSAIVVLGILYWWDSRQEEAAAAVPTLVAVGTNIAISTPVNALPTATPGPGAGGPIIYIVKTGDTLGTLSQDFGMSMEDIIAANELANPDQLFIGQELLIPVGGLPTATPLPSPTAVSAVAPSPIPTEPLSEGEVIIEITGVTGAGVLTEEAVAISNLGNRPVALVGWQIADNEGHQYVFGQVTLFGDGAAIAVHTETGVDGTTDLYWGLEEAIWESGETVTLLDSEGTIQATYTLP